VVTFVRRIVDSDALRWGAAAILIAFGLYRLAGPHRARRTGMQVGFADLTVWSFLMATGHGAGLMLVPVLLRLPVGDVHAAHLRKADLLGAADMITALVAVVVHSLAMLVVAGAIAVVVYEWVGLAFLRRGWINLDLLWALALFGAGATLLAPALQP
jgi:cytochrome b subunit of formate dehydrogenase